MLFLVKGCMVALHINHTSRTLPEKVGSLASETEVFTNKFTRNGLISIIPLVNLILLTLQKSGGCTN